MSRFRFYSGTSNSFETNSLFSQIKAPFYSFCMIFKRQYCISSSRSKIRFLPKWLAYILTPLMWFKTYRNIFKTQISISQKKIVIIIDRFKAKPIITKKNCVCSILTSNLISFMPYKLISISISSLKPKKVKKKKF